MLTVKDIATELKVTERTVRRWIKDGKLKTFKIQGVLRVDTAEFLRFKERGRS